MIDELKAYCDANGVPYRIVPQGLIVMDATQLPSPFKEMVGNGGLVAKPVEEAAAEPDNEVAPPPKSKKGGKP